MVDLDKIKIGDLVCVSWLDAMGDSRVDLEDVKHIPPSQLLVETKTYGTVLNIDNVAIAVAQENSESGGDYTIIPEGMIEDITILTKLKGGNRNGRKRNK